MRSTRAARHLALSSLAISLAAAPASSQQSLPPSQRGVGLRPDFGETGSGISGIFLQVPISNLAPGAAPNRPAIKNPAQDNAQARDRGMKYFTNFNCSGCHADNGGGGMA